MKLAVEDLARFPGVWRGGELEHVVHETVPTGCAALDRELPGGGWPLGTLTEVLHDGVGIGEVGFLGRALATAARSGRLLAWTNPPYLPYAPALAQAGIPLERCVVIEPAHREDALWAAEQALRSGACGGLLLWLANALPGEARAKGADYAWLRRLQLAAQAGGAMAVLYRSTAQECVSTPAHLRVVLARRGDALELRIPKRRGPPLVAPIRLDPDRAADLAVAMSFSETRAARPAPVLANIEPARPLPRIAA
jgi:hypothetical protein